MPCVSQPKEQREKTEMIAFLIQGSGVRVLGDLRLSGYMDSTLPQQQAWGHVASGSDIEIRMLTRLLQYQIVCFPCQKQVMS